MHYDVVSVPFKRHIGEAVVHPLIESEMQKDICEHGTDDTPLRCTSKTRLDATVRSLNAGFQPALDVEQHPSFVGEALNCPHHQRVVKAVENERMSRSRAHA